MMFGKEVKITNDPYSEETSLWDDIIIYKE
jgi:hypothetical protein